MQSASRGIGPASRWKAAYVKCSVEVCIRWLKKKEDKVYFAIIAYETWETLQSQDGI
jgi:hypothetical protein